MTEEEIVTVNNYVGERQKMKVVSYLLCGFCPGCMDVVHSRVGSPGTCTVLCTPVHSCGGLVIMILHTPRSFRN